jgi:hypothetical protein
MAIELHALVPLTPLKGPLIPNGLGETYSVEKRYVVPAGFWTPSPRSSSPYHVDIPTELSRIHVTSLKQYYTNTRWNIHICKEVSRRLFHSQPFGNPKTSHAHLFTNFVTWPLVSRPWHPFVYPTVCTTKAHIYHKICWVGTQNLSGSIMSHASSLVANYSYE